MDLQLLVAPVDPNRQLSMDSGRSFSEDIHVQYLWVPRPSARLSLLGDVLQTFNEFSSNQMNLEKQ